MTELALASGSVMLCSVSAVQIILVPAAKLAVGQVIVPPKELSLTEILLNTVSPVFVTVNWYCRSSLKVMVPDVSLSA